MVLEEVKMLPKRQHNQHLGGYCFFAPGRRIFCGLVMLLVALIPLTQTIDHSQHFQEAVLTELRLKRYLCDLTCIRVRKWFEHILVIFSYYSYKLKSSSVLDFASHMRLIRH